MGLEVFDLLNNGKLEILKRLKLEASCDFRKMKTESKVSWTSDTLNCLSMNSSHYCLAVPLFPHSLHLF
jgi:hypothetical protein